nr:hypothetical protein [Rhizobium leguminosarum]
MDGFLAGLWLRRAGNRSRKQAGRGRSGLVDGGFDEIDDHLFFGGGGLRSALHLRRKLAGAFAACGPRDGGIRSFVFGEAAAAPANLGVEATPLLTSPKEKDREALSE